MAKKETIKEKLAILRIENKYQTAAIDDIKKMLSHHVKSSDIFRNKCIKNQNDIKWIKRISLFIISGGGLLTIGWNYIKTKIGG